MTTLNYSGTLVVVTCWCGLRHAVPSELQDFQDRQFDNGEHQNGIYCPLGHSHIHAGDGEAARLAKQLEKANASAARVGAMLDQEKASHRATKGQLTKARKRISNGVCPCCNRQFVNVERHMKTQHPDFGATQGST